MSTLTSLYVRVPPNADPHVFLHQCARQLERERGELVLHPNATWIELRWRGFPKFAVEVATTAATQLDTEVLFAVIQTAASVFELGRYTRSGEQRYVASADGSAWTARGNPEAWEQRLFAPLGKLDEELEEILAQREQSEHPALIQLFRNGFIVDGQTDPLPSSSGSYAAVAEALGMTAQEFDAFAKAESKFALRSPLRLWPWVLIVLAVMTSLGWTFYRASR